MRGRDRADVLGDDDPRGLGAESWPISSLTSDDDLRPLTALFADVVGSTSLGERLSAEEVKALIGEWTTRAAAIVERYGGTVGAWMGDGIAAFFGLDTVREDGRQRAALAALAIVGMTRQYADEIERAWELRRFAVRVGMSFGRVAAGPVGAHAHRTALGDPVNVAARLQSAAEPGSIVVSDAVAVDLASRFALEPLGRVALKGRRETVEAWRLLGEDPTPMRAPTTPFVGRASLLSGLEQIGSEVVEGRGRIALLVGDAGVGKSRLLAEVEGWWAHRGLWLAGRCSGGELEAPYRPFVVMLRSWLGVDSRTTEVAVRVRLRARLRDVVGPAGDDLFPYLGRLLRIRLDPHVEEQLGSLPGEVLAAGIRGAYVRWLAALTGPQPVAVVIDDLDRADPATCELAAEVLASTDLTRMLFAAALRPDPSADGWDVRVRALADYAHRAAELWVPPLSRAAAEELVRALDSSEAVPEAAKRAVVNRAEGNPLYLEELFGVASEEPGLLGAAVGTGEGIPPGLEELLLSRVHRLPAGLREVLQVAAVIGRTFERRLLEAAVGHGAVEGALASLLRAGLVRESAYRPTPSYTFKHGLLHEAVLASLPRIRRRELHHLVAQAVEEDASSNAEDRYESLAGHFAAAGESRKAIDYLQLAARRVASVHGDAAAIPHLEHAVALAERLGDTAVTDGLRADLAASRARAGDFAGAADVYRELLATAAAPERPALATALGHVLYDAGDFEEAARWVADGLAAQPETTVRAQLVCLAAQVAFRRNRYRDTRRLLDELDELWCDAFPAALAFDRARVRSGYSAALGDYAEAQRWSERALEVAERAGRPVWALSAHRNLGLVRLVSGDLWEAERALGHVYRSARGMGYAVGMLESGNNLLCVYLLRGALHEAEELAHELLADIAVPFWRAAVLMNLGTVQFELGRPGAARRSLTDALVVGNGYERVGDGRHGSGPPTERLLNTIATRIRLAAIDVVGGAYDSARGLLEQAIREAEEIGGRFDLRVQARVWMGELLLRTGRAEEAEAEAVAALEAARRAERGEAVAAWRLLGRAREARSPGGGREALERALTLARATGMRLEEARALVALGVAGGPEGERLLQEGRELLVACGAGRDLRELSAAGASFHE